jgi:hypothetical protein
MCRILPRTGESNYFISYKRLGAFAKLATTYVEVATWHGLVTYYVLVKRTLETL